MPGTSLVARYAYRLGLTDSEESLCRRAAGAPAEIIALIDELLVAQVHAICFENLDVLSASAAGQARGIPTDIDSVSAKLLDAGRGGYCHEHATLIRAVLIELGLHAEPILARVHLGGTRTVPGGLSHEATVVDLDGRRFLVDPGFGGGTPEAALEIRADAAARFTEAGEIRLVPAADVLSTQMRAEAEWALQSRARAGQDFRTVYAFADQAREQADLDQANWFTATKPGGKFTTRLMMTKRLPHGGRVSLDGSHLTRYEPGIEPEFLVRSVEDAADFAGVLAEEFGLTLVREFTDPIWIFISQP